MKSIHTKSPCCHAPVHRYGSRRRLCTVCKKTWRIRQKKRGRTTIRVHPDPLRFAGPSGESLRFTACRKKQGRERVRRRHRTTMGKLIQLPSPLLQAGPYIAVIDGFSLYFQTQPWTTYLILLRPIHTTTAVVMPPLIRKGPETIRGWEQAFVHVRKVVPQVDIRAVVSDGIIGMDRYTQNNNQVHQRCHCHLLRILHRWLGLRWRHVSALHMRRHAYACVKTVLTHTDEHETQRALSDLQKSAYAPDCPHFVGMKLRGFLRVYEQYRSWITYPDLHLPTTTNSAETICGRITELVRRTRGFSTVDSYEIWVSVLLKLNPTVTCNGKGINQISVS